MTELTPDELAAIRERTGIAEAFVPSGAGDEYYYRKALADAPRLLAHIAAQEQRIAELEEEGKRIHKDSMNAGQVLLEAGYGSIMHLPFADSFEILIRRIAALEQRPTFADAVRVVEDAVAEGEELVRIRTSTHSIAVRATADVILARLRALQEGSE